MLRHRLRYKQTGRQTDIPTYRYAKRNKKKIDIHIDKQAHRHTNRQTDYHTDKNTDYHSHKQNER